MTDNHIDAAIDRAVRDMTSVDAPQAVAARVLARLEPSRTPRPWIRLAVGGTLAAAALAAFFILPLRERDALRDPGGAAPTPPTVAVVPPPVEMPRPEEPGNVTGPREIAIRTGARIVSAAVDVHTDEPLTVEVDPLSTLHPIIIPAIEHRPIGPESLALAPLAPIPEVHVEPLTPRGERD